MNNKNLARELLAALQTVADSGLLHGPTTLHDKTRSAVFAALAKAEGR